MVDRANCKLHRTLVAACVLVVLVSGAGGRGGQYWGTREECSPCKFGVSSSSTYVPVAFIHTTTRTVEVAVTHLCCFSC